MIFARTLTFINKYQWWIYTVWALPTFIFWLGVGFYAAQSETDTPGGLYLFTTLMLWFFIHFLPVILLATVLALFRWRVRLHQRKHRSASPVS
ncbi:hypothetical protein OMR58_22505 [Erwinia sp. INIA-01]|uniref:hypothetical protein n=1 Tax=Erwinia sp. INIA01 TaxID=2991500 RepID=UPI0022241E1E|nr:hypothetical protein [Erwinia sp. INIA01]MCW1877224.1 hypothetical protein [Erwinia sp. INIA01]